MPRNGDMTKARIIETGLRLFKDKGFNNVSIDEICRQTGITRSAFYYHFQSKDQIFDTMYEIPLSFGADIIEELMSADDNWSKLWRLYEPVIDWTISLGYDVLSNIMVANLQHRHNTFFPAGEDELRKIILVIIRKGQETGQFLNKSDPNRLYELTRSIIIGIAFEWCNREGEFDEKEAIESGLISLLVVTDSYC